MNDKSDHTFIILAHKESLYLEECIQSLLGQTISSEILLSTSTPSDFLENISAKYNIPLIINGEQRGIAADWSFAYNRSGTKYVTLAHQDDMYCPQYTEIVLASAAMNSRNLIIFTDYCEMINGNLRPFNILPIVKRLIILFFFSCKSSISSSRWIKLMLSFGNPVCCPSIMYNSHNIGPFEFNRCFTMNLDWEAALRLAQMKGDFIYVDKKLTIRRIHKESESANALDTNARAYEDRILFSILWPKLVSKLLLKTYSRCYKYNR